MITVEKISGGWLVAAMVNGYRVKSRYFGYTKKQSIAMFKEEYNIQYICTIFVICRKWYSNHIRKQK